MSNELYYHGWQFRVVRPAIRYGFNDRHVIPAYWERYADGWGSEVIMHRPTRKLLDAGEVDKAVRVYAKRNRQEELLIVAGGVRVTEFITGNMYIKHHIPDVSEFVPDLPI